MSETKKNIVVFDFDGTLIKKDSFVEFARFVHGNVKASLAFLLFSPLLLMMKCRLVDSSDVKEKIFSHLYGEMPLSQFKQYGIDFANHINAIVNPIIFKKLRLYQAEGLPVYVVSASIEEWVRPWCIQNGINHIICTKAESCEGFLTGKFSTPNCNGMEKVHRLENELDDLSQYSLTVYGDSHGDDALMDIAEKKYHV